jgi:Transcriptional regulator, AbiEi antitoxin, Type IV TA system
VPKAPAHLDVLRRLPFVKGLRFKEAARGPDQRFDGALEIRAPSGTFRFLVEEKRSFLTRESVNELIARLERLPGPKQYVILFAPYIARPMADTLIAKKVAFVDLAGNISLNLGNSYHWTEFGNKEKTALKVCYPTSPAPVQLLILYLTKPESLSWSVRQLATEIDVRHAWIAVARKELQAEGLLAPVGASGRLQPTRAKKQYKLGATEKVLNRIREGYNKLLRPKIKLGQFRYQEKTPDAFLERLAAEPGIRPYALTGAPAVKILQRYYTAPEVPIFCYQPTQAIVDRLRLLPDREGPVTLLRPFGNVVFGEERSPHRLAPPCLIYAELFESTDLRAHEAAEQLRREFLT